MPTYRSTKTATLANRKAVYEHFSSFFLHLDPLNITVTSIVYNGSSQRIDVVTTQAVPSDHLGDGPGKLGIEYVSG